MVELTPEQEKLPTPRTDALRFLSPDPMEWANEAQELARRLERENIVLQAKLNIALSLPE